MVGSTALSERLDAEALRHVLLRYYALMRGCLERYGGTVEKFIGDAVMAVFGVPAVHEDDALRACRAALDMLEAVAAFGDELEREVGTRFAVRIGVHTGEVVASGSPSDGHTLVSGEVVNIAARLEQHAPAGQVLIGAATRRLAAAAIEADPLEPITVKGIAGPVPVWSLRSVVSDTQDPDRRSTTALVDRSDELTQLRLVLGRVERGRNCHLVTLFGDPGVGKTRLLRAFAEEAGGRGAQVAGARCLPYGSVGGLAPLAGLLNTLLGESPRDRLATVLGTGETAATASAVLLRLAGTGVSGTTLEETCWALQHLFTALAGHRPLVAVVDDLQWANRDLLAAVDHLADWVQGVPLLLVCGARPELLDQRTSWGSGKLHATSLVVPPLAPDDCRELVSALVTADAVSEGGDFGEDVVGHATMDLDRLVARSEGNPLFLTQITGMLREGGDAERMPLSVRAVIEARLDRLAPEERAVLEAAAVIGTDFTTANVAVLRDRPGDAAASLELEPVIRALLRRRLVEAGNEPNGRLRFASQLVRDVAYERMPKLVRAGRHERFAEHLEGLAAGQPSVSGSAAATAFGAPPDAGVTAGPQGSSAGHLPGAAGALDAVPPRGDGQPGIPGAVGAALPGGIPHAEIGTHMEQAYRLRLELGSIDSGARDVGVRAAGHLAKAGTTALRQGDIGWAEELLARAIALPGAGLDLRVAHAEARLASGDTEDAVAELLAVLEEARGTGDRATAARARLQLAYLVPETDPDPTATAQEALEVCTADDDPLGRARALLRLGQHQQGLGQYAEAAGYLHEALDQSVRAGAELDQAGILGALAVSLWLGPEPTPAALRRCREFMGGHLAGRRLARATISCPMAVLLAMRGRFDDARSRLADAEQTLTDLGHLFAVPATRLFTAATEVLADRLPEAESLLRGAAEDLDRLGDRQLHANAVRDLARVLLLRSGADRIAADTAGPADPASAEECRRLIAPLLAALSEEQSRPGAAADLHGMQARLAAVHGDAAAAEHHLTLAEQASRSTDSPVCRAGVDIDRAHVAAVLGRTEDALDALHSARDGFAAKGHLVGIRRAETLWAALDSDRSGPAGPPGSDGGSRE
ncbi:AAA family ATPase [Streptomyces scabichelini]|nr:adenylate/guanylate cyclase domain-containing protein [Streptomyces scabichelini]